MKSSYTKQDLIAQVIRLRLVEQWSTKSIVDFLTNDLKYSKTQAYEYIKWARLEMKEKFEQINESAIEEAIFQYEELLEKAIKSKNYKLWNDLRKELNKILGIYAAEKIDLTSGGEKLTEIKIIEVSGTQSNTGIHEN